MNQYEREEEQLERDLAEGRITRAEYNKRQGKRRRCFSAVRLTDVLAVFRQGKA